MGTLNVHLRLLPKSDQQKATTNHASANSTQRRNERSKPEQSYRDENKYIWWRQNEQSSFADEHSLFQKAATNHASANSKEQAPRQIIFGRKEHRCYLERDAKPAGRITTFRNEKCGVSKWSFARGQTKRLFTWSAREQTHRCHPTSSSRRRALAS